MILDINKIRADFPILKEKVYNKNLVYFDNGATTQKPKQVIDTISEYYSKYNANIHRGVHFLSNFTTEANENSRKTIQNFINAKSEKEIIFTKGTTDSINLVAFSFGEAFINEGDEIIISEMEHHSNIVPWQMLCERKNAKLKILKFNELGELKIEELNELITNKTKLISVSQVSNALGTVNPIKKIIEIAHKNNVKVLVDGAQAIQHLKLDVQELDCDFYAFSSHKAYGPTGVGILYGKEEVLNKMHPYQGGGEMISSVSFEKTIYNELPFKFEAGTPNYIDNIAFAKALEYISEIGLENIEKYENQLLEYCTKKLKTIENIKIIGEAKEKSGVISFIIKNIHHNDIAILLDQMGIAVRSGTHCAEPVMQHFGISGTVRISFAFYNTLEEIDYFITSLNKAILMLQ
ncbi:MAG: cysteine desulfurase [Bacteroidales bacterium]|nr:cysteine desulfurase [Bacteroidales bacterium]MCK9498609.1 cysteine desulfurase [Bacteroidales bacterium]